MRVFVAGVGGAVGRRLLPLLVSAGHSVVGSTHTPAQGQCDTPGRVSTDLYGAFPVKWLLLGFAHSSLFGAGKAVLHPVACDSVPGARGRGQGSETLAELWWRAALAALVFRTLDA